MLNYTKRRRKALMLPSSKSFLFIPLLVPFVLGQVDPRWGQASTLVGSTLYVHGGKVDLHNEYSYTSAPNSNQLLSLDLSTSFPLSSPPWTPHPSEKSPSLAFHTISPYSTSQILLFGGDGGPDLAIATNSDSSWTLSIPNPSPIWMDHDTTWAQQPTRRLYHSSVYSSGKVWIIGGLKGDGSGLAFRDAYSFDPNSSTFSQLPTANSPPDLVGHASLVSSTGLLYVFGGYSPSLGALQPFNTAYILDTTASSPTWSMVNFTGSPPSPRRDFAAVMLDNDKILIHGGSDASHQRVFSDGAILDLKTKTWSTLASLATLGQRFAHMAVPIGSQVLFGFGYSTTGPVSSNLMLFDPNTAAFPGTFTPPPPSGTPTIPGTSPPPTMLPSQNTVPPGDPNTASPDIPNSSNLAGSTPHTNVTAIAVGSVFGVLALVVLGSVIVIYYLRSRDDPRRQWNETDEHGEKVTMIGVGYRVPEQQRGWATRILNLGRSADEIQQGGRQRIDMLADEDVRRFDTSSTHGHGRRGFQSSSHSYLGRAAWDGMYNASVTSLRSIGAAFGRFNASSSRPATPGLWEKDTMPLNPFTDAATSRGDVVGTRVGDRRSRANRESSASAYSQRSYNPFSDANAPREPVVLQYIGEHDVGVVEEQKELEQEHKAEQRRRTLMQQQMQQLEAERQQVVHADLGETSNIPRSPTKPSLAPLTLVTSIQSNDTNNTGMVFSTRSMSPTATPSTSNDHHYPQPLISLHGSYLPQDDDEIKRSDSFWSRFSRDAFRPRSNSQSSAMKGRNDDRFHDHHVLEFKDPTPAPPRLGAIEESSSSPEQSHIRHQSSMVELVEGLAHNRSLSSVLTADSETIEKLGGNMQVVQRIRTASSHQSRVHTDHSRPLVDSAEDPFSDPLDVVLSPTNMSFPPTAGPSILPPSAFKRPITGSIPVQTGGNGSMNIAPAPAPEPRPRVKTGGVAARIQAYERRMSQEVPSSPISPSTPTGASSKRPPTTSYGLVPKPKLFVANAPTRPPSED